MIHQLFTTSEQLANVGLTYACLKYITDCVTTENSNIPMCILMYPDLSIDAKWKALSDYMHVSSIYALVHMHQRYTVVGLCVI